MAKYNSSKKYNKNVNYNSSTHYIVVINDSGLLNEFCHVPEAFTSILDEGQATDVVRSPLEFPASEYFIVTTHGILEPLGVRVTGDSRNELLPSTRDTTEEIPGRHGELDFVTEFKTRLLELSVVTNDGYTAIEKKDLERLFAMYLNPIKGPKKLIFADDIDKAYPVKYSGKIDIANHPTWFQFTIPFKMANPFIVGSFEKTQIGSGTLVNEGTHETGVIIEIAGPATNPFLNIGSHTLTYTGTITSGQTLIIDTEKRTVKLDNNNARANYNRVFPLLYPGETTITAPNNTIIKWRNKWI